MACFNNFLPQPPRTWYRVQDVCSVNINMDYDNPVRVPYTNEFVPPSVLRERLAMLNKGNVLQYKANSSNLTKAQKYSKIAKGQWVNRNTTWATQSTRGYTNPNNSSLKRSGNVVNIAIDPITGAVIGQTNAPVTCPTPVTPVNEDLPSNGGSGGGSIIEPEIPPPVEPVPGTDTNVFPETIPETPVEPTVIQDEGILICSIQENVCTGETKTTVSQQLYYPTSDSDVPGSIQYLYWNDGTPTWYPRQRYTMTTSNSFGYEIKYEIAPTPFVEVCESCDILSEDARDNSTIKEIISYTNTLLSTPPESININLTITQINNYLEKIEKLRNNCNSGIIDNYVNSLKLIFIMLLYKTEKDSAVSTSETYKQDSITLNNKELLEEWIKNKNKTYGLFGDVVVKVITATLKPEYLEYHKLYGIPMNLMYDTELLTEIKKKIYN